MDYAEQVTRAKLLVRLDAANDDMENIQVCHKHKADWIIKRNLRKESLEDSNTICREIPPPSLCEGRTFMKRIILGVVVLATAAVASFGQHGRGIEVRRSDTAVVVQRDTTTDQNDKQSTQTSGRQGE